MKLRLFLNVSFVLLMVLMIVAAGCGSGSKSASGADKFGTNKLETAFAEAGVPVKGAIQKAEASIKSKDYGAAYDTLFALTKDTSLSPEQTQAIKSTLEVLGNYPRKTP